MNVCITRTSTWNPNLKTQTVISCSMTTPQPTLLPSSIFLLPSSHCAFIALRKNLSWFWFFFHLIKSGISLTLHNLKENKLGSVCKVRTYCHNFKHASIDVNCTKFTGDESRLEDCPIRLNGQVYGHIPRCYWDSKFIFIHCGERNLPAGQDYWGGIRYGF